MNTKTATADARFLRRILLALVLLTTIAGGMAGYTAVQAMNGETGNCKLFCE
jgi:hypothetical protein